MLATANAAGYRYGVSDQAFYVPAVQRALDPAAFPRDAALIDAQGHLLVADEAFAALVRTTGIPLEFVFFGAYLLSLGIIWSALVLIGARLFTSWWATAAMAAAFTLRHRIPRTSANSFEPYFHPRMLAFGICLLAIAALLRLPSEPLTRDSRRTFVTPATALPIGLVALAALVHVTTALWFAILIGVALCVLDRRLARVAIGGGVVALACLFWAVTFGPLRASMTTMDAVWLQAVASKDSLFASDWPIWAWAMNLLLLAVLWIALRARRPRDTAAVERALAWGATALVLLFVAILPLVTLRLALPVQLQMSRVFWMVDVLATLLVVAAITDRSRRAATTLAVLLLAVSVGRGAFVMGVENPERSLFAVRLAATPWHDAMAWLRRQPIDVHVLADPGHSWKYGTSVRVSAGRDVLLEDVKDSAIAMYSRDVAGRVVERLGAIGDFGSLDATRAGALGRTYDIDYLVTEAELPLPIAYRNDRFRIYSLQAAADR